MSNETTTATTDAELIAELRDALSAALEWIDAVPKETPLPPMPGFDRDWADSLLVHVPG
jgi:hypothetical protein